MGLFKKIRKAAKKVGYFAGDIGKTISYTAASSVNSITGHKYTPKYKTKAGKVLGGINEKGTDNLKLLGKSFADGISDGAATKAANKLRKKENRETAFTGYTENRKVVTGVDWLDKGLDKSGKVSIGIGATIGKIYGGQKDKQVVQSGPTPGAYAPGPVIQQPNNNSGLVAAAATIAAIAIGLK
jgi:hypothetical protein